MLKGMLNKLFVGDNLKIMREMPDASVNLIYLDPPFCTGKDFKAFDDRWHDGKDDKGWYAYLKANHEHLFDFIQLSEHFYDTSMKVYLTYMTVRLFEMKRILKDGRDGEHCGSIFLHCDPTASHYLKLVMDSVFGKNNFRNEIVWRIGWVSGFKSQKRGWIRNHDTILYYTKTDLAPKAFNKEYIPYPADYVRRDGKKPTGKGIPIEDTWNCSAGDTLHSIMIQSFTKEKTGYPTQKPLALLDRIIRASSNENDVVLDPFCGCATACVAAEKLGRQWIGIDISPEAIALGRQRFQEGIQREFTLLW